MIACFCGQLYPVMPGASVCPRCGEVVLTRSPGDTAAGFADREAMWYSTQKELDDLPTTEDK